MNIQFKTSEECAVELVAYTGVVDSVGSLDSVNMDMFPVRAARVSFAKDSHAKKSAQADEKLMRYLADHQHLTPFEYQHATVMIECPLFIRSQIHRHRTFSFNEISRRYTSEEIGFWKPSAWRGQAKNNRQASEGQVDYVTEDYELQVNRAVQAYEYMLDVGICREQARAILPQSLLTRFYMGGNLRNWAHFLKLRMDSHAQPEVQVIANRIHDALHNLWPTSVDVLMGANHD